MSTASSTTATRPQPDVYLRSAQPPALGPERGKNSISRKGNALMATRSISSKQIEHGDSGVRVGPWEPMTQASARSSSGQQRNMLPSVNPVAQERNKARRAHKHGIKSKGS